MAHNPYRTEYLEGFEEGESHRATQIRAEIQAIYEFTDKDSETILQAIINYVEDL